FYKSASCSIVLVQLHVVLVAVNYSHINVLLVGAPGNVGQVLLGWFAGFQERSLPGSSIVNTNCYMVAFATGHRVFNIVLLSRKRRYIYQWVIGNHGLVHAVERQTFTGR